MITVTFLNQKGGVGKSSLSLHLAGALVDAGKAVLAIDLDSQASLTQAMVGPDAAAEIPWYETSAVIASGELADPVHLIRERCRVSAKGASQSIFFVAGSRHLLESNVANPYEEADDPRRQYLRYFLAAAAEVRDFDYCLVDCPPNLAMSAAQALAASEYLVIPTQVEDFGVQGLRPVIEFLEKARATDNPYLKLAGIIINIRKRRKVQDRYEAALREHYGSEIFETAIPDLAAFPDSITFRLPVTWFTRGKAAKVARAIAEELIARTGGTLDEQVSKAG